MPPRFRSPDEHGASPWPPTSPAIGGAWGGYVELVNAPYVSVSASYTLPVLSGSTESAVAFWVGFDGFGGYNGGWSVEQCGFDCVINGSDSYTYDAWSEFYPGGSRWWSPSVYPVEGGDSVSAAVTWDGENFNLTLSDITQGWSYTEKKGLLAAQIEESTAENSDYGVPAIPATAPILRGSIDVVLEAYTGTLANFGTVTFTDISPTMTSPVQVITKLSSSENITVSSISDNSFSMVWLSGT